MKADLYIGDDVHSVELVSPPRVGELVIFGSTPREIWSIAHDCDKRKLSVFCYPKSPREYALEDADAKAVEAEIDTTEDNE